MNSKIIFGAVTTIAVVALIGGISMNNNKGNKWGLVYENAITKNVSGAVNIHPVTYKLHGNKIVANVYTPANYNKNQKYPAIVIAHPNGGVKEQVAGLYAENLARAGYITIAADASYQGASGGEPRHTDKPANRIEDIHGMVDYISQYPGVDASHIGALGICGGGGYTLAAMQSDKRVSAVATLSMFNSGRVRRNGYRDSQLDTVQQRLKSAADARAMAIETGKEKLVGSMANVTDEMANKMPFDLYREGYYYYLKTHAHPNSTFEYTESSLMDLMAFDATDHIDLVNIPLLLIAGEKADSLYMSQDALDKATGTDDKELFLIPGATHIQTYYVPEYVDMATKKLTSFFDKNLKK